MRLKPKHLGPKPKFIAVLDVGTAKVACFIARVEGSGHMRILGIGHQLSRGIRAGVITDVGEAQTSIVTAVHAAEEMAGHTVEDVLVSLNGGHTTSHHAAIKMTVSGDGVTSQDLADILDEGRASVRPSMGEIIHCFPTSYALDGTRGIRDPRAMVGNVLEADVHLMTAQPGPLRNIERCVARAHLNVSDYAMSSYAAGLGCLEPDEMELGTVLVDMGAGTTSIAVFHGGHCLFTACIPVGGAHVTSDIAKGLSTTVARAERLKVLHGSAVASVQDTQVMLDVPQLGEDENDDDSTQMPRSALVNIIQPRVEEIFELVRDQLAQSGVDAMAARRMVLTGGASQLFGVRDVAGQVLGRQVRGGRPHAVDGLADAVSGPAFATAVGMLEYALARMNEDPVLSGNRGGGIGQRLFRWLRRA